MSLDPAERERILDAVFSGARDAAEVPMSLEEEGDRYIAFVVDAALRRLAEDSYFPEPAEVRAVLRALAGVDDPV